MAPTRNVACWPFGIQNAVRADRQGRPHARPQPPELFPCSMDSLHGPSPCVMTTVTQSSGRNYGLRLGQGPHGFGTKKQRGWARECPDICAVSMCCLRDGLGRERRGGGHVGVRFVDMVEVVGERAQDVIRHNFRDVPIGVPRVPKCG